MKTLIDEYFEYQLKYEKKYGIDNTLVLMEVGKFYESYGLDNDNEKIGDIKKISEILRITLTRRNKSILENSRSNPQLVGFPSHSLSKFINLLIDAEYNVIMVEQTTPPPKPERAVTRIFSPGTYIDEPHTHNSNNILSLFITKDKNISNASHASYESKSKSSYPFLYIASFSIIDLTTGKSIVYETYSKDIKIMMEEIYRVIETHSPCESEILYYYDKISEEDIKIISKLRKVKNPKKIPKGISKLSYQNDYLKNIFKDTKLLSPIEFLNLETNPNIIISFILLLQYVEEHDNSILIKLEPPIPWEENKHLILHNNTIHQLDISTHLLKIIDETSTPMGKRLLKYNLLNPMVCSKKLNKIYDEIENHTNIKELKDICDIERYHRKLSLKRLHPSEFYTLILSYENILKIQNEKQKQNINFKNNFKNEKFFLEYYEKCKTIFNEEELSKCNLNKIENSFFNKNIFKNIDDIETEIKSKKDKLNVIAEKLSNIILNNSKSKSNTTNDVNKINKFVKVKHTEKSGYYLETTNTRAIILKKYFDKKEKEELKNELKTNLENSKSKKEKQNNYNFKKQSNITKIESKKIEKYNQKLFSLKKKLEYEVKEQYIKILEEFDSQYHNIFIYLNETIAHLDFINSCAIVSKKYGYVKPIIVDGSKNNLNNLNNLNDRKEGEEEKSGSDTSFIEAVDMRHPVIERLNEDIVYVPNDVSLNGNGILLYGINGSGKSSYMKSVGVNVILAQMGMYVACKSFKFSPFRNIYTRIQNNDDIAKGHSSFDVEMHELRPIIKYGNSSSLILGDELCRGTEDLSAPAIFGATINILARKNINFVFATHLHKLEELVNDINNLKIFHISVDIDKNNNIINYRRKLKEGRGTSLYGLEVARLIIDDEEFNKIAKTYRDILINKTQPFKTSKYNKNLYITECQICNCSVPPLDTHHIKFQSHCNEDGLFTHIQKDSKSNLVVLCKKCHVDVHNDKIIIDGYIETSDGILLNYKNNNIKNSEVDNSVNSVGEIDSIGETVVGVKSRKKFDDKKISIIKKYNVNNPSLKYVKNELKKQNIKISVGTIKKIFNNNY